MHGNQFITPGFRSDSLDFLGGWHHLAGSDGESVSCWFFRGCASFQATIDPRKLESNELIHHPKKTRLLSTKNTTKPRLHKKSPVIFKGVFLRYSWLVLTTPPTLGPILCSGKSRKSQLLKPPSNINIPDWFIGILILVYCSPCISG